MTTLLSLPVETIQLIPGYLSADDFRAFRQTCRDINAKTFSRFARTYFQTRYVMLEKESLNTLIHISEHPLLGPEVRTLGLCTDHFTEPEDGSDESQSLWSVMAGYSDSDGLELWPSGELSMWPEDGDDNDDDVLNQSYATTYRRYFDAQEDFLSGPDIEALRRAMRRLSNCKTLLLTDACIPWGGARLEREIGELDRGLGYEDADSERFVKHVLHVMLTAAMQASFWRNCASTLVRKISPRSSP
ncbi:F-box domain-containing protein [Fusarium sp. LHS14.1]|nr:F-box domain-containing protein [Fusarium sp. LHS14.1]